MKNEYKHLWINSVLVIANKKAYITHYTPKYNRFLYSYVVDIKDIDFSEWKLNLPKKQEEEL
uniref:Uncharacterized protein n=1 Tax=viral metagenome TaxID=1070528 RepID=A0A6H1ZCX1_9ZZZZ